MNTVFIYELNDPVTGRTRYIGKAKDPKKRFHVHMASLSREQTHKSNWIKSLLEKKQRPVLVVVDEVPEEEWPFWECEYIRLYRLIGFDLTNGNAGGEGSQGHKHSEETINKIRAANIGRPKSEETKARMRGRHWSMHSRIRASIARSGENASHFGKKLSEETKNKMRVASGKRIRNAQGMFI